jgi:hypothetical protein
MAEKITRCSICGCPVGECDPKIHAKYLQQTDPGYGVDTGSFVATEFVTQTKAPTVGAPFKSWDGKTRVMVNPVTYNNH